MPGGTPKRKRERQRERIKEENHYTEWTLNGINEIYRYLKAHKCDNLNEMNSVFEKYSLPKNPHNNTQSK